MGVSDGYGVPGHCWDKHPAGVRCLMPPRHSGPHFNWHTRDEWPNPETDKPAAQGIA